MCLCNRSRLSFIFDSFIIFVCTCFMSTFSLIREMPNENFKNTRSVILILKFFYHREMLVKTVEIVIKIGKNIAKMVKQSFRLA